MKQGTYYTQGQTVLDRCYSRLVGVQVTNSLTNAWAGSIETSVDERDSYSPMMCIDGCHGTSTTDTTEYITVDGDATIGIGDAKCFNGGILFLVSVLWLFYFYYGTLLLIHLCRHNMLMFFISHILLFITTQNDLPSYQLSTIQEGSCSTGLELSQTECEPAAISLGLDYTIFQVSTSTTVWSHIPCGCSYMSEEVDGLNNKLVYNTNTVNCQWETRTIGNLCYPTYQLSTIQDSSCPTGLELSQIECEPAATSLGLDYSSFQVSSWLHLPCGCSYMSEAVDGLTNKLVYNTNTVNCDWETRTIGNVCEFQRPYYELVSQMCASS